MFPSAFFMYKKLKKMYIYVKRVQKIKKNVHYIFIMILNYPFIDSHSFVFSDGSLTSSVSFLKKISI